MATTIKPSPTDCASMAAGPPQMGKPSLHLGIACNLVRCGAALPGAT